MRTQSHQDVYSSSYNGKTKTKVKFLMNFYIKLTQTSIVYSFGQCDLKLHASKSWFCKNQGWLLLAIVFE